MEKEFSYMANAPHSSTRVCPVAGVRVLLGLVVLVFGISPAAAQEQILFPAINNVETVIIQKIRAEQVRVDIATWLLVDDLITREIVAKKNSGVPVRVIGDRGSIFEGDQNTRASFEYLASNGVPIRLRYYPRDVLEILHWKCGIFVGQNTVEFGSANWTSFELAPFSSTDFKDETAMFTNDPTLVNAFMTKFDEMWADTTYFLDWPDAYRVETGRTWTAAMTISRARLVPPGFATENIGIVWSQGSDLINAMIPEIDRETQAIEMVEYRLTVPSLTDALIRRRRAGVPVRVFIEPTQYHSSKYPEYELTGAEIDRLWVAGIPIKQRVHDGITHMKVLLTSRVALIASSNFTRFWERDHNYFMPATGKPTLYFAMKDRFNAMWNDSRNFTDFQPLRPDTPVLVSPNTGSVNVPTNTALVWNRAPFAVAFDIYVGPTASSLAFVGRVNAQLDEYPPATYSLTPTWLQPSTTYYWRVVSRTFATDVNASLVAASDIRSFTTGVGPSTTSTGGCSGSAPVAGWVCVNGGWIPPPTSVAPPPESGTPSSSCTTIQPGAGWLCINGGWVPPDSPLALSSGATSSSSAPSTTSACTTIQPGSGWLCINGGWVPPNSPLALSSGTSASGSSTSTAQPSTSVCTTIQPGSGWLCINGGWVPPNSPLALSSGASSTTSSTAPATSSGCTTVQPAAGWVCVNGGWVPPTHPLASGGLP